jgi:DNA-binding response OmpR family regulator
VTRRILLVDDEPSLRYSLARALHTMGYEVVTASEPMDAYALLEPGGFDLVLLDINLPRMSGDALYLALVRREPGIASRVLLMSGDPWAVKEGWPAELQRCPMLVKPFGLDLLARVVASTIAAADAAAPTRKRNGG